MLSDTSHFAKFAIFFAGKNPNWSRSLFVWFSRMRLRKKTWKNPGIVYLDSQVFEEDIQIFMNFELFVEELSGGFRSVVLDNLASYLNS